LILLLKNIYDNAVKLVCLSAVERQPTNCRSAADQHHY